MKTERSPDLITTSKYPNNVFPHFHFPGTRCITDYVHPMLRTAACQRSHNLHVLPQQDVYAIRRFQKPDISILVRTY